eukprot:GILJ01005328.1.p1 GENE.GILJ01005328.1~~GILJ01005328.1.p1  ORF type:complete len:379 (-),score=32.78 GILJ01005328.1:134-1231(-)
MEVECPPARLLFRQGTFTSPQHLEQLVTKHHFNSRVELFAPGLASDSDAVQQLKNTIIQTTFYEMTTPLETLCSQSFVDSVLKSTRFAALSKGTPIDRTNSVAILRSGSLHLNLERDTYQQLGLVGKPSMLKALKGERYTVTVDMLAPSWRDGKKLYERAQWAFKDRTEPVSLYCYCLDSTDGERPSPEVLLRDVGGLKLTTHTITLAETSNSTPIPNMDSVKEQLKSPHDKETVCLGLYEWIGLCAANLLPSLYASLADQFLSSYMPEVPLTTSPVPSCSMRWTGFISPEFIFEKLAAARNVVKSGSAPWIAVTVWGFEDAPISFGHNEHSFSHTGGSNGYTCLVLPNEEYLLFTSLGAFDQTT